MSWHSVGILGSLSLLAPVALLSALEVVVLALGALPSSFGELEVTSSGGWGFVDGVIGSVLGAARSGGVVLKVGVDHLLWSFHHLRSLLDELLHVWEELLLLNWLLLLWVSIIVIDDDVVCYCWWCPDWVLGEDGSVLLWLLHSGLDVLDKRIEGASTLVEGGIFGVFINLG